MRTTRAILFAGILLSGAGALWAQGEVHIPLTDASRPAQIHVHLITGGITVRGGGNTKEIVVDTRGRAHGEAPEPPEPPEPPERPERPERGEPSAPPKTAGMHRLDLPGNNGLDVTEHDNVVDIKTSVFSRPSNLVITVPRRSSLELKTISNGGIQVEQVDGEIDVDALNGAVTLNGVSGSVVAHSLNGAIVARLDRVDASKPMSFSTLNGEIDVTLPDNVRANVRMKTDNGEIYSDFDVKLDSSGGVATADSGERRNGRYHFRMDRTLRGTINGGGPEYQFTSFNGAIYIRKKK